MEHTHPTGARHTAEATVVFGAYVGGTLSLALAMRTTPGSAEFAVLASLAAGIWLVGSGSWRGTSWNSGPRDVVGAGVLGLALAGLAAALAAIGVLGGDATRVAEYADRGAWQAMVPVVVVSAVAEEMLFRDAVYRVVRRSPSLVGTVAYVGAAACTGNGALVVASLVFGPAAAAVRIRTGALGPPVAMHVVFSLTILSVLPRVL